MPDPMELMVLGAFWETMSLYPNRYPEVHAKEWAKYVRAFPGRRDEDGARRVLRIVKDQLSKIDEKPTGREQFDRLFTLVQFLREHLEEHDYGEDR
jgi:hypothetical protein